MTIRLAKFIIAVFITLGFGSEAIAELKIEPLMINYSPSRGRQYKKFKINVTANSDTEISVSLKKPKQDINGALYYESLPQNDKQRIEILRAPSKLRKGKKYAIWFKVRMERKKGVKTDTFAVFIREELDMRLTYRKESIQAELNIFYPVLVRIQNNRNSKRFNPKIGSGNFATDKGGTLRFQHHFRNVSSREVNVQGTTIIKSKSGKIVERIKLNTPASWTAHRNRPYSLILPKTKVLLVGYPKKMYQEGKYTYTTILRLNQIQQKTQEGTLNIRENLYSRKINTLGAPMSPKWVVANEGKRITISYKPRRQFQGRLVLENKMPFPVKVSLKKTDSKKVKKNRNLFFHKTEFTLRANRKKIIKFKGINSSRNDSETRVEMLMRCFDMRLGTQKETLRLYLEPRVND